MRLWKHWFQASRPDLQMITRAITIIFIHRFIRPFVNLSISVHHHANSCNLTQIQAKKHKMSLYKTIYRHATIAVDATMSVKSECSRREEQLSIFIIFILFRFHSHVRAGSKYPSMIKKSQSHRFLSGSSLCLLAPGESYRQTPKWSVPSLTNPHLRFNTSS